MKKILLSLVVVLSAVGIIGPKIVGGQVDSALHQIVTHFDTMPGYSASISDHHTTWFTTTSTITIALDLSEMNDQGPQGMADIYSDKQLIIEFSAAHGPVLFGQHSGLGWVAWTAEVQGDPLREYIDWTQDSPLYQVNSTMNLLGTHVFSDKVPPFTAAKDSEISVDFSGYQGQGSYNGSSLSHHGLIETFNASELQGSLASSNISFSMDADASFNEMFAGGLYGSNSKMTIEHLTVTDSHKQTLFSLDGFDIIAASTLNESNQQGDVSFSLAAKSFTSAEQQANNLLMASEINHINSTILEKWQQHLREMKNVKPAQMQEYMLSFFNDNLLTQLVTEPQVNITKLQGTLEQGSFDANMHTSLVGITALPDNLQDIPFWLSHLLVNGQINGDKAAIEHIGSAIMRAQMAPDAQANGMSDEELNNMALQQTQGLLQMLTGQGLVVATETHYKTVITLEDNEFMINDKAIPLPGAAP